MVKKENVQGYSNSLLRTATNGRLGASKFALLALRSNTTTKAPIKKVKVPKSNESAVSELTGSINELPPRPAVVKENKAEDISVESSILEMSMGSSDSSGISIPAPPGANALKTTPQPKAFQLPKVREVKNLQKKEMEIQKGLKFSAPSPMSLDRVQVQMGQEKVVPESKEYQEQHAEDVRKQEKELKRMEFRKAKQEIKEQVKKEVEKEQGEGFEAQLEDFTPDMEMGKKKSLMKKILGKIKPKSPRKRMQEQDENGNARVGNSKRRGGPLSAFEARLLARRALDASKSQGSARAPIQLNAQQNANHLDPTSFPLNEISTQAKEDSISDLDASVRKFPVNEIRMGKEFQARDDESVSTLGTPRILDSMGRLQSMEKREPTPSSEIEGFRHRNGNALFDQNDSFSALDEGTEAIEMANARGYTLAAACLAPELGSRHKHDPSSPGGRGYDRVSEIINDDNTDESETFHGVDLQKSLSPINEAGEQLSPSLSRRSDRIRNKEDLSPKQSRRQKFHQAEEDNSNPDIENLHSLPDLENVDENNDPNQQGLVVPTVGSGFMATLLGLGKSEPEVIDLTQYASSPSNKKSPTKGKGVKFNTKKASKETPGSGENAFSFDDFMNIAASKLGRSNVDDNDDDRYAIEGDASPKNVIVGQHVEANPSDDSIPVVQGVEIESKHQKTEVTPKASGGAKGFEDGDFEVYDDPEGDDVVVCQKTMSPKEKKENGRAVSPNEVSTNAPGFKGYFSDGLFDLLSADGSTGQKKATSPVQKDMKTQQLDSAFQYSERLCGGKRADNDAKQKFTERGQEVLLDAEDSDDDNSNHSGSPPVIDGAIGPNLGVMCGALPLYFMYSMKNAGSDQKKSRERSVSPRQGKNRKSKHVGSPKKAMLLEEESSQGSETDISEKDNNEKGRFDLTDSESSEQLGKATSKLGPESGGKTGEKTGDFELAKSGPTELPRKETASEQRKRALPQVLLDRDDVYWDTLSTIASTKDRSSIQGKFASRTTSKPGPIPVEIAVTSKEGEKKSTNPSDTKQVSQSIGKLNSLIGEDKSTSSLSDGLAAEANKKKKIADGVIGHSKSRASHPKKPQLSRVGSISGDESIQGPPSHNSKSVSTSSSKVAGLIAKFEATGLGKMYVHPSSGLGKTNYAHPANESIASEDNSALLLAITRTESENLSNMAAKTTQPDERGAEEIESEDSSKKSMEENEKVHETNPSHPHRHEATGASTDGQSRVYGSSSSAGQGIYADSSDEEGDDYGKFRDGINRGGGTSKDFTYGTVSHSFAVESKSKSSGNRTVSWGFEEIFEAPEPIDSPSPSLEEDEDMGVGRTLLSAIAAAAAGVAASKNWRGSTTVQKAAVQKAAVQKAASLGGPETMSSTRKQGLRLATTESQPVQHGIEQTLNGSLAHQKVQDQKSFASFASTLESQVSPGTSLVPKNGKQGDDKNVPAALGHEEEQELISRTLQLSQELLATMNVEDVEQTDNEVVKSLMLFGSDDDEDAPLSLVGQPHISQDPQSDPSQDFKSKSIQSGSDSEISPTDGQVPSSVSFHARESSNQEEKRSIQPVLHVEDHEEHSEELGSSMNFVPGKPGSSMPSTNTSGMSYESPISMDLRQGETGSSAPSTSVSGISHNSPIDVEGLFTNYDNLANHLIEENGNLKTAAAEGGSYYQDEESTSDVTPELENKLGNLRAQRAKALARFQASSKSSRPLQFGQPSAGRERDRLKNYSGNPGPSMMGNVSSQPRPVSTGRARVSPEKVPLRGARRAISAERTRGYADARDGDRRDDIDSSSIASESSSKSAPSQKARDLRRQLDEALHASREIRRTQEALGSELAMFKNKFYHKNDEIGNQAKKVLDAGRTL